MDDMDATKDSAIGHKFLHPKVVNAAARKRPRLACYLMPCRGFAGTTPLTRLPPEFHRRTQLDSRFQIAVLATFSDLMCKASRDGWDEKPLVRFRAPRVCESPRPPKRTT